MLGGECFYPSPAARTVKRISRPKKKKKKRDASPSNDPGREEHKCLSSPLVLKPRRRVARIEMSIFYAVLSVRPHTGCNRNLDIRTGQGDLGS